VSMQPAAFMSCADFDDVHEGGKLTQFRERLSAEVQMQTGQEFPIFQDRNDRAWGQSWQARIDQNLDAVSLLLPIVTPSFFRSPTCRAEFNRFLELERRLGRSLILPIYYISTPELDDPGRGESDELARVLASRQYTDWRELRFEPSRSSTVGEALARLADRVRVSIWAMRGAAPPPRRSLAFEVVEGDILTFDADVVAFKYAQEFYGADWHAAQALARVGIAAQALQPKIGEHRLVEPGPALAAGQVVFVGVPRLGQFRYRQIRDFGTQVIHVVAERVPDCRDLALTLHGPGIGLDEVEALFSILTGCMEAVAERPPPNLRRISVVERDAARVDRLRRALQQASHHSGELAVVEAERGWLVELEGAAGLAGAGPQELSQLPGAASEHKPHIFVAMPFAEDFGDLFEYGIQRPVRDLGFLCERVDQAVFTGDILERVKSQIETCAAMIAVLTGANPNVYLEVGYAWGKGRPTILVTEDDPRFDLQGQRYLRYRRIKDVEELLTRELGVLKEQGHI
jgi:hypothetical protein